MRTRPLCTAALVWAAVLWLLGKAGFPCLGYGSPDFPVWGNRETAVVAGTIYAMESHSSQTVLYLKETNLLYQGNKSAVQQKYPLDRIKVYTKNKNIPDDLYVGDRIKVVGRLEEIPFPGNPGQFNERVFYYARKIKWYQKGTEIQVLKSGYDRRLRVREKWRDVFAEGVHRVFSEENAGILEAMLLGKKERMKQEHRLLFQILGCSHMLAISGLHISILGGGLLKILRRCCLPPKLCAVMAAGVMFFYGEMTGNGASVRRASVMFAVSMAAFCLKRTYDLLTSASLTAILLLAENPYALYDSSFLLSFGAVIGLGLVNSILFEDKRMTAERHGIKEKIKNMLQKGIAAGISVWYCIFPLVLYFFFEIPVWGLVVSVLLLPFSGILLLSGFFGTLFGFVWNGGIGRLMGVPAEITLWLFLEIGKVIKTLPGSLWVIGQPEPWRCALYYAAAAAMLWQKSKKRKNKTGIFAVSMLFVSVLLLVIPGKNWSLKLTFLDVGQGDCACIQTGSGSSYLVDGGSTTVTKVGRYRMVPFLKASGIRKLEGVFVSHMDEDHVNGIRELLEMKKTGEIEMEIVQLFLSKCAGTQEELLQLEQLGREAGCDIVFIQKGSRIRDGNLEIFCMGPDKVYTDSNEGSQVLHVSSGGFDVLFTGDVEGKGEQEITRLLSASGVTWEVLKVAHHGSKHSTGEAFLSSMKPEKAVISSGKENLYGHPHKEVLQRLYRETKQVYLTSQNGAVGIQVRNPFFSGE